LTSTLSKISRYCSCRCNKKTWRQICNNKTRWSTNIISSKGPSPKL